VAPQHAQHSAPTSSAAAEATHTASGVPTAERKQCAMCGSKTTSAGHWRRHPTTGVRQPGCVVLVEMCLGVGLYACG
jgi:hypothetical protein